MWKTFKTKHINPLNQKQSGWQYCFYMLHIYIIIFIIKVHFSEKSQMDYSSYQAITSASLTSKTVLTEVNLQDLTYMVILMPWILIKSLRLAPEWELKRLEGWCVKRLFVMFPSHFTTKESRSLSQGHHHPGDPAPKLFTRPSVLVQTEVQSSPSPGSDVGHRLVMGGLPTRLEGPDWRAPTPCLVLLGHAPRPRFNSQVHHGFLITDCLETGVNFVWVWINSRLEEETFFQRRPCPNPASRIQLRLDIAEKKPLMDPLLPAPLPYWKIPHVPLWAPTSPRLGISPPSTPIKQQNSSRSLSPVGSSGRYRITAVVHKIFKSLQVPKYLQIPLKPLSLGIEKLFKNLTPSDVAKGLDGAGNGACSFHTPG